MRVVVTGASGNIGSQVVPRLAAEGHEVVGVVRRAPTEGPLAQQASWQELDLSSNCIDALTELCRGADAVIHLAWLIQPSHDERTMRATNVLGSQHVLRAVRDAGVPALIVASSVGAYSRGPKDRRVEEDWTTGGIPTSIYSAHKVLQERMLDELEAERPEVRVVRIRPGVVVQKQASSEQARYFLGPFVPMPLIRQSAIPIVPALPRLAVQVVHAEDVAAAFVAATTSQTARGAYNVAAEPVLTPVEIGEALHARPVPFPTQLARIVVDVSWRLRLQPTDVGWVDLALGVPLMSTRRARDELGWAPTHDARDAIVEAIEGVRTASGGPSPVLRAVRGPLDQILSAGKALLPKVGGKI